MAVDEDCMRTHFGRGPERHGGMHSELASFIRSCRIAAALVALSANYDCLAFQRGVEKFFYGDEESVHIDVEDGAGKGGLIGSSHVDRNFISEIAVVRCSFYARARLLRFAQ